MLHNYSSPLSTANTSSSSSSPSFLSSTASSLSPSSSSEDYNNEIEKDAIDKGKLPASKKYSNKDQEESTRKLQ